MTPNIIHQRLPEVEAFMEACVENGMERNDDYNGPVQYGVGETQQSVRYPIGRYNRKRQQREREGEF